jgi:hypothetical protein
MQNIDTEITDRPIFKPSAETEKLINRLKKMEACEILTWMEMHEVAGLADRAKLRGCLVTARKHLLSEDQACFAAIKGIGLKRLPPGEVVDQEGTTASKVRRTVKASLRRLSTVNPDELPQQGAQQHRITSASLGAIALCVKPSNIDKVKQVFLGNGRVDGSGALALFQK